jgi:hypothetical protein
MKTKFAAQILAGMVILLAAGSCREEIQVEPATFSLALTGEESKTWKLNRYRFIFDDPQEPPFDVTYLVPPCNLDDLFTYYRKGKVLEITEGASRCNENDPDLIVRTQWEIVNASSSLFLGGSQFFLIRLTEDSLVYGVRDTLSYEIVPNTFELLPGYFENTFLVEE